MDNSNQTVELATPSIAVDATTGEIIASINQVAGYTDGGEKSFHYYLNAQPRKDIMPSAYSQLAVPKGFYTTGDVTILGDVNLVPENIRRGVQIFGVTGTYDGE